MQDFLSNWANKRSKLQKKIQRSTNRHTKEYVLYQIKEIEKYFIISINIEINPRKTRAIAAFKTNPKYFYKFLKNNSAIRAGIGPLQDEEGAPKQQKNKPTTEGTIQKRLHHSGPNDDY